jgi:uncharacterized membrane protein HdeD (DUF308 family)
LNQNRLAADPRRLWPIQIAVGTACIALAIAIAASPGLGNYAFLALAGAGLLVLGAERIATGIRSNQVKTLSRVLNIGIGIAIIVWIGSGFFFPEVALKWLNLFFGFGLLADGAARIIDGLRKREESPEVAPLFGAGVIITAVAIAILVFPQFGLVLLIAMTAIALAVSGAQIIMAGVRGRHAPLRGGVVDAKTSKLRVSSSEKGIFKRGSWFGDNEGRYLLFRGVNFGSRSKLPPYLPIAPLESRSISEFDLKKEIHNVRKELDLMKFLGFNIVRLLISWKAIEPRPNPDLDKLLPEGQLYLSHVKEIVDALYARQIYVILDFHQDIANERFGGDGFPDWAVAIDEKHPRRENANLRDKKWLIKYVTDKSVKQTLRSFWRNDLTNIELGISNFPVRTHLEETIGLTAQYFRSLNDGKGHPAIIGIEPFNEPHPVGMPKEQFEEQTLMQYYTNVNTQLARHDPDLLIFVEPRVDWTVPSSDTSKNLPGPSPFSARNSFNMGMMKNLMVEGKIDSATIRTHLPQNMDSISRFGSNGVLSFHYYDMMAVASAFVKIPESMYTYRRQWPIIFRQLVQSATERGLIPFLSEFGAFQEGEQVREYLNLMFEQVEATTLNSTYWNYDLYHSKEGKDNWNLEDYSLLGPARSPRNIDVVARPYPMRSSAEPILLYFDIESKFATLVLKGEVVEAPTVMYIPRAIHYTSGFTVWGTGSRVIWDADSQLLTWFPEKRLQFNQIVISNSPQLAVDSMPDDARKLGCNNAFMGTFA